MSRQAQISMEYLILTGIILLVIIVPSVIFLYSFANKNVFGTVSIQKINDIGNGLADNAKQMYYLGLYSKKIVTYNVPENVERFFILEINQSGTGEKYYYLGIIINNGKEVSKHFFPSDVPLMSNPRSYDPNAAYVDNLDSSSYINECTPSTCTFYNFKSPVTHQGKKKFKLETMYDTDTSSGNEVKVNIIPLID